MKEKAIVECQGLSRQYQMGEVTVKALRHLDLQIEKGELIVLLGPSGSGKTTTLNLIGGLDRPSSGQLFVDGQDIAQFDDSRLTAYRRNKVGLIFQFFNLIPSLTASENVEFALALTKKNGQLEEEAVDLLGLVGLKDRATHFPSQLSGGEQQRVAIVRALANQPPLLLCDEPTGNLDVGSGRRVLGVIQDFQRRNKTTVLLITHNTAIAPIGDRVIHLRDGQIDHIEVNLEPQPAEVLTW
jgi:putative ABC transport system ATP-binding protein